ncbi:hypothetical protein ACH492_13505 [Streptomyces sp. NPDC019443]|nr:hypothetical protein [Streptomyces sp. V1I1]MDQ0945158.1 hypothetical protein [Streptomyces sp. V1I1]
MSTRAVLVAALITGFVLGIAGARADHSTPPRETGPIAEAGR